MTYVIILWFLIICLTYILIKQLNIQKNIMICIFISILIIVFALNINTCIPAAIDGCKLWYKAILPTTFPFVVICNLLIYYDGITLYSKFLGPLICKPLGLSRNCSFPIAASILCGYPLGAKYCADIYSMGYIEKNEYERLLNIASNVGPLFLIGSVGVALLNNVYLGYILLIGSYLSAFLIGLVTKKNRNSNSLSSPSYPKNKTVNFGLAIKNAVENGVNTTLSIGGFIIIFSVIISVIESNNYISNFFRNLEQIFNLSPGILYGSFLGSIEITNGCNILSSIKISLCLKMSIISFLCSFSGLAIIAQVSSFVSHTKINFSKYIFLKVIQGIFSFVITYALIYILPTSIYTSTINSSSSLNVYLYFIPILILLVLTLLFHLFSKLFFHAT
ncbi:sporulation integral membrane protein YlbJ [Clostridium saccharobutylicum]|uniref:Sporulation integral membrane protein YlbJ n=1 Tax=Clostridium saccharobutylicum DSM 13864 TaxID=1345695 RepID=U5MRY6_CLOSA|nr:sporulation integral membrane protein YlbJ [Clostridium saccharobutylicum]AGX42386.1 sporulation integral membrane protein YlbJ [Clostridium saccharobutylicum DSM 13864]AQR89667.1 sporulation integral membrane protein YlbJ [Clostridium saccharobutylicum]AQR99569.1 sporulation integral membrane protein YlbJ [Clostridium saccharobutylicum]AQS13555.1 sporulation integral membrane protein YlbJ [Clostridium saccharobutylicum]MBA2904255.1 sporulation integral membrane protein YlbJ [Clostridium sa